MRDFLEQPRQLVGALSLIAMAFSPAVAQKRGTSRALSTADIAAAATPATVTILAIGAADDTMALGSGFIIRKNGVIVTNYHVLRGASSAIVLLASKERFTRVSVLDADSTLDLALLKIPGAGLPTLATRTTIPRVGEKVIAIGSPLGLAQTVSDGILSATRMASGHEMVQITAPISHGSSGGAVLDAQGRVFAISTSLVSDGQALNFAIPVRYALGLLGDDPHPRQIAEVFRSGDGGGVVQQGAPVASASGEKRRASAPRASVAGIYIVRQAVDVSDGRSGMQVGYLISSDHVALLVLASYAGRDSLGPTHIYNVDRWATTANGDVVLTSGQASWDGYQTDDGGFLAHGRYIAGDASEVFTMSGAPTSFRLSRADGVYAGAARTRYRASNGQVPPDFFDWRGELAVAFAHDTIYTAMYLTNDRGGFVLFKAHGPLTNHEEFDLRAPNNSRLHGFVRNGTITASWEDVRANGGSFVGTLSAARR